MYPTLLKIGSLSLHTYGLLLAVAFLLGIQLFVARARARGLPEEPMHALALWLLVLAIVGGRVLFVLTHWSDYAADPLAIVRLWEGGLMLYGGYLLAIAGGIVYVRRKRIPVWRVADAAAPSMALGVGIGRLGCFMNGCCFGLPTSLPWGVHFPHGSAPTFLFPEAAIHPSQLYLSGAGFVLFGFLLAMDRTRRFDGRLFWIYIAIDAAFRFVIDFTRYYDETSAIGSMGGLAFNVNQILSAGLILASAVMLRILSRRPPPPLPEPATGSAGSAAEPAADAAARPDAADSLPTP